MNRQKIRDLSESMTLTDSNGSSSPPWSISGSRTDSSFSVGTSAQVLLTVLFLAFNLKGGFGHTDPNWRDNCTHDASMDIA